MEPQAARPILVALLAASLVGLSGCMFWEPDCLPPMPPELATPWVHGEHFYTHPDQTWDTLVRIDPSAAAGNWTVTPTIEPAAWSLDEEVVGVDEATGAELRILRVHPGHGEASLAVRASATVELEGYCSSGRSGSVVWELAEPTEGDLATSGKGVHVMTAGFWATNGTLFYTNIAAIDEDPAWPKAGWYMWEGGEPLPVYVYDQDRSEEPVIWHGTTYGTPLGPPTNDLTLWDYFTTIKGFNEALKGLSTTTTRVVRIAPEDAYTRAGNEHHPLYGDELVFYIKLLDVVDVPCPLDVDTDLCMVPGPFTAQ